MLPRRGWCRFVGAHGRLSSPGSLGARGDDEQRQDQPLNGNRQIKIVTQHHFMWVGQAPRRDTPPLKTEADTLRRNSIDGGAGTYSATGNRYVEQVEVFNDPNYLGKPWSSTCRVQGDRWYHSWSFPQDSTGVPRDSIAHVVEVWRRVE